MLKNEIKILRSIDNKNLSKLDSVYETPSSYYMIYEFYSGGNLKQYITENGILTESQAAGIMRNILEGVKYLHNQNIIHRDINPETIFFRSSKITEPNPVFLADFMFATSNDVLQYIFPKCGTPGFAAPEIYAIKSAKEHYSLKCDLFSLGVTLYYMLTGGLPYSGERDLISQNQECDFDFYKFKEYGSLSKQGFFYKNLTA